MRGRLHGKRRPSKKFTVVFYACCVLVIFLGAIISMDAAWAAADITMGLMTLINLPCCVLLSGRAIGALKDYEGQKKAGKNPVFKASAIGMKKGELDFWD